MREENFGPAKLILGDANEILDDLPSYDALLTDPPYGIGIAANPVRQKHEKMDWDDEPCSDELLFRCRAKTRWQIIWGGNYFLLPPTQHFLIWNKLQPENLTLSMCEFAWTNLSGPAKMFTRHVVSYDKIHPTQKPLELMVWCIERHLPKEAKSIFDPFMGVATTGVAALRCKKSFVGIEIVPAYFDLSCRRIEEELRDIESGESLMANLGL